MTDHDQMKARCLDAIASATQALERGDAAAATRQCIDAANFAWACFRVTTDWRSDDYRRAWEEFVLTLRRLPPTVLRRAVEFLGPAP
jgi:hypothetical protein